jgi:hypothetical protein
MPSRVPERADELTVYLVLNDHGSGCAYVETDPAEADRETIIQNFLAGQYGNALRVVAFNTAVGLARDVSEDIAKAVVQRAIDADEILGVETRRFIDRHVADPVSLAPRQDKPVDLIDSLNPDFKRRPPAPSVRRLADRQRNAK